MCRMYSRMKCSTAQTNWLLHTRRNFMRFAMLVSQPNAAAAVISFQQQVSAANDSLGSHSIFVGFIQS